MKDSVDGSHNYIAYFLRSPPIFLLRVKKIEHREINKK